MISSLRILMFGLVAMALGGCGRQVVYDAHALAGETFTINAPQTVIDSSLVQQAQRNSAESAYDPWWHDRNDGWLNVRRDQPRGETIHYVTYTEDRVQTFGNRVYDVHRQVTYSSRHGRIER